MNQLIVKELRDCIATVPTERVAREVLELRLRHATVWGKVLVAHLANEVMRRPKSSTAIPW
ncbi:hypothetical protein [Sphingomonas mucosissima]|uniref:Uncharacterized protein n=1 Tax=Sphingomonas mucosissima TaxID=370959 RepID=A0A245ZJR4_9SPHN|nr:hypothetical protein [Sphingomonas mucosissima]OWK29955.1 hypothetical protein SPMU_23770 [Sphingomonas mucosissima]